MIILLIAEARSGSTNLAKWLHESLPNFRLLNEPFNYRSTDYVGENGDIDYSKNIIISKKYFFNEELVNKVLKNSDKVFCLTRENTVEQIESYMMALKTNNWYDEYSPNGVYDNIDENILKEVEKFKESKNDFKKFIEVNNLKSFTYENLFLRNGIDELKLYLNIDLDVQFPYGKRYRHNDIKKSLV